jgi:hypothetical protein
VKKERDTVMRERLLLLSDDSDSDLEKEGDSRFLKSYE